MTNGEKLREVFPRTIFIYQMQDNKTCAIMCSDEWLDAEYTELNSNKTKRETVTEFADRCRECGREKVLDKIRTEIMRLDYDLDSVEYDYNDMTQTEIIHTICREEVLQVIDKYKAHESEG